MSDAINGPLWAARNWSSDAGAGSIHDDDTASELGFRGGTVAGSIHMNQFPPVLIKVFGNEWFERGNLSLDFKNATVDTEEVQVFVDTREENNQVRVWMERNDGMLVCEGTAAMEDHSRSELRTKDLRACDPSELKILSKVHAGMNLGEYDHFASSEKQFDLFDRGLISDPLDWYRNSSPWGDAIASPSMLVQIMWGVPMQGLRASLGKSVGLFGAIEVGHVDGPLILDRDYTVRSEVVCVGQSPKTEYMWFDTSTLDKKDNLIASFRMMLRFMKASSPLYS